jgi:4-carboxymuconolactone decarboxylase
MARLPYVDLDALPAEVREQVAPFAHLNVARMLGHLDGAFGPWHETIAAILTASDLPPALREVAILRVSYLLRCEYEHAGHVVMGRRAGLTEDQIATLSTDAPDPDVLGPDAAAVSTLVDQLHATGSVDDDAFAAVHAVLGDGGTVKLVAAIGLWTSVGYVLNATGVELDTGETRGVDLGWSR